MRISMSAVFCAMAVAVAVMGPSQAAMASDCVRNEIANAPDEVEKGDAFRVQVAVKNCGETAGRFTTRLWLVDSDGHRIALGRDRTALRPDTGALVTIRARIGRRVRAGEYALVAITRSPAGAEAVDRVGIVVIPRSSE